MKYKYPIIAFWFFVVAVIIAICYWSWHHPRTEQQASNVQVAAATDNLSGYPYLPNPKLTPGDALPNVTVKMLTRRGYAKSVRAVPESEKKKVYAEYGVLSHRPGEYEVDHLISLELGGSNSIKNLWPEPYQGPWNAHIKDKLEDRLHYLVVNGKISLREAQLEISTNWIKAYGKYCKN